MKLEFSIKPNGETGTTAELILPAGVISSAPVTETSGRQGLVDKLILVIDDEIDILDGTEQILHRAGAEVLTAFSAIQAIDALHQTDRHPDLILADFRLANDASGIDAVRLIRDEFNLEIPAILISGDTSPSRLSLAEAAALPLLHKPVTPDEILQKMQNLL